jgi:hypothetical protein
MDSIADDWWNEDRRELFRSVEVLASDVPSVERLCTALDTILNDLELYDDPRQGADAWLFDNELQLADKLGDELHTAVGDATPVDAGAIALPSGQWANVRATAGKLISLMVANGDFSR